MRVHRTLAIWTLALALFGASILPCPPPSPATGATAREAHAAHPDHHATAPQAAHPADCPEASRLSLEAPCPCGCEARAPASASARLGYALLPSIPAIANARGKVFPAELGRSAPLSPSRPIDHVPRLG